VQVESGTQIQVLGLDPDGIRLELGEGRIQAKVQPGNTAVEIAHGAQSAQTVSGAFSMSTEEDGGLLVRSEEGDTLLSGFGEVEKLEGGSYAYSAAGEPIISAREAQALLLNIQWPDLSAQREASIEVTGQTMPNIALRALSGDKAVDIRADEDGKFELELSLKEGKNTIELEATDPLGRSVGESRDFTVDSTPPATLETEIQWVE